MSGIRPKAVCVFRRGSQILVGQHWDLVKAEEYFVPPGGGMDFGEHSSEAVRRELREEVGVELEEISLLGVRETVFEVDGQPGHDVVFVYTARCADPSLYGRDQVDGVESDGTPFSLRWRDLEEFSPGGLPLYPEGLYELLRRDAWQQVAPDEDSRALGTSEHHPSAEPVLPEKERPVVYRVDRQALSQAELDLDAAGLEALRGVEVNRFLALRSLSEEEETFLRDSLGDEPGVVVVACDSEEEAALVGRIYELTERLREVRNGL